MARKFPILPANPQRTCWGCDRYCKADAMICGNGTERTQHPSELWGPDWATSGMDPYLAALAREDDGPVTPA